MADDRLTLLVTGIGGRIGRHIVGPFREAYELRTLDRAPVPFAPEAVLTDLQDIAVLKEVMRGVDVVLHLAATSDEAPFLEQLVPNNVVGLYNTLQAAHEAGVRRVVFASTGQTVSAYPREKGTIEITDPPRPSTMYGATKVFGETLGRWYHDKHGLEFVGIRIGWFLAYDDEKLRRHRGMNIWLSPRDTVGLFRAAIETPDVGYALVFGTSKNPFERLSLAPARERLDWEPEDDAGALDFDTSLPPATRRRVQRPRSAPRDW